MFSPHSCTLANSPCPCTLANRAPGPWLSHSNFHFVRGECRGLELLKCKVQSISCWANMGFTSHALECSSNHQCHHQSGPSSAQKKKKKPIRTVRLESSSRMKLHSQPLICASRRYSNHPPNPAVPYSSSSPPGSGYGGAALWYVNCKPPLPYLWRGVFEMSGCTCVWCLGSDCACCDDIYRVLLFPHGLILCRFLSGRKMLDLPLQIDA